jgi:ketosteroid isomerase-like protein
MKLRLLLLLFSITILAGCNRPVAGLAEQEREDIRQEITTAFDGLAAGAKSPDVNQYFDYFNKDKFTALNSDGTVTHSFEEFKKSYLDQTKSISKYESLDFKNVKITVVDKKTAILVNEYKAKVILNSGQSVEATGAGTQVWSKTDNKWKLVSVSSSAMP